MIYRSVFLETEHIIFIHNILSAIKMFELLPIDTICVVVNNCTTISQHMLRMTSKFFSNLKLEKINLCNESAMHGYFNLFKWARQYGCPWDEWTCAYAAMHGHLKILIWARTNGCPWDDLTCMHAAENGHLDLLYT